MRYIVIVIFLSILIIASISSGITILISIFEKKSGFPKFIPTILLLAISVFFLLTPLGMYNFNFLLSFTSSIFPLTTALIITKIKKKNRSKNADIN